MADVKFRALVAVENYEIPGDGRSIGHLTMRGAGVTIFVSKADGKVDTVGYIANLHRFGPVVLAVGFVDLFAVQPGHVLEIDLGSTTSHKDRPLHFTTASLAGAHLGDNPAYPQAMLQIMPDSFDLFPDHPFG